jgi:ornithine carbamoyltransferase
MTELGGHAQYLRPGEIHLGGHETVADTARVISRLVDAIMARTAYHTTLAELVQHATVPVINGLTDDYDHPVQTMTDAMTILEHFGTIQGLTCAFVGKCADAMGTSVALTMTRLGSSMVMAGPPEEQMTPEVEALARANCAQSGACLTLTDDAAEAVAQADVVFTVGWWWMQPEDEKDELRRILRPYQVNEELWAHAKPGAKFMHCLPAVRGEEMTDGILDAPFSIVLDEAENRKHLQKALLLALIGIDELPADAGLHDIGRALLA